MRRAGSPVRLECQAESYSLGRPLPPYRAKRCASPAAKTLARRSLLAKHASSNGGCQYGSELFSLVQCKPRRSGLQGWRTAGGLCLAVAILPPATAGVRWHGNPIGAIGTVGQSVRDLPGELLVRPLSRAKLCHIHFSKENVMKNDSNRITEAPANRQNLGTAAEKPQYETPVMYVIGQSAALLQGSGRHKNDDTGSRGFTVDQR
jgi:hypothetical protein